MFIGNNLNIIIMKSIYILIITLFYLTNSVGQDKVAFDIQEIFLENADENIRENSLAKKNDFFYEDDDYIVTKSCSGEWGGSIFFKSKKSGIKYSCKATCPVSINLINGKYIITNTLAHLNGSSSLIEIKNPELMSVFEMPKPRRIKNGVKYYYRGDNQSKSTKGVKRIWSDYKILTLASFPFKKQLYHIVCKNEKTFLATIEKNELKLLDQISNKNIWSYESKTITDEKGNLLIFFNNHDVKGYIEIKGKKIKLMRLK